MWFSSKLAKQFLQAIQRRKTERVTACGFEVASVPKMKLGLPLEVQG
jgi:hypothetical protein